MMSASLSPRLSARLSADCETMNVRYSNHNILVRMRLRVGEDAETFTESSTEGALKGLSLPNDAIDKKEIKKAIRAALVDIRPKVQSNKVDRMTEATHYAHNSLKCTSSSSSSYTVDWRTNVDFLKKGFHRIPEFLPPELQKTLLQMHKHLLPDNKVGGSVHHKNGARSKAVRLEKDGWSERRLNDRQGNLTQSTFAMYTSKNPNKGQWVAAIKVMCHLIGEATGRRAASLHEYVDAMLQFPGQTSQSWHMDGLYESTGAIIFLTEGAATEFGNYHGKAWMHMTQPNKEAFHKASWETVTKEEHAPRSAGRMQAGDILFTQTGHIHRAPRPPAVGFRRTLFVAFETEGTRVDSVVVTKNNWEAKLTTGGTRKGDRSKSTGTKRQRNK
jgi:hypothetical protein